MDEPEARKPPESKTEDAAVAQAPANQPARAPGVQVVPVATDAEGSGWGVVGFYVDDVGTVDVEQDGKSAKGKVEKSVGGEGLTRLAVSGAPANATVQLVVTPA